MNKKLDRQFDKLDTIYWSHDSVGCVEIADNHAINFSNWLDENKDKQGSKSELLKQYKNTTIQAWHLTKKSIMSDFYLVPGFTF